MTTTKPEIAGRRFSRSGDLCQRYNVSPRTIYRWIDAGILPQPININNRLYFDNEALEEKERERMRGRPDDTWQPVGDVAKRVVDQCGADIRDHNIRMQRKLNQQKGD